MFHNPIPNTYNGLKLSYSQVLMDETAFWGTRVSLYHSCPFHLGLHCRFNLDYPTRTKDDFRSLFARKMVLSDINLSCWATDTKKADILLQDGTVWKSLQRLAEILKSSGDGGFILNDGCISVIFPDDCYPSEIILRAMYDLSISITGLVIGLSVDTSYK